MATEKKTVDQRSFRRRQNVFSPVATSECAALCFPSSTSKEKTRDELALAERSERERQSKGLGNRGIFKQPPIFVFFLGPHFLPRHLDWKNEFSPSSPLTLIPPTTHALAPPPDRVTANSMPERLRPSPVDGEVLVVVIAALARTNAERRSLSDCVAALSRQSRPPEALIVVDDGAVRPLTGLDTQVR